eukprot:4998735-Amphidinium_carterae.1
MEIRAASDRSLTACARAQTANQNRSGQTNCGRTRARSPAAHSRSSPNVAHLFHPNGQPWPKVVGTLDLSP